jgi:Rrf2 family protein
MLRLSKKADYALMAMKHLAGCGERGTASAREIAERYEIPVELLAKVLQRLVRKGLLASHQGTRGGYHLAHPAGTITVADVIQAIDGPLTVTACSTDNARCDQYSRCSVRDPLWRIKDLIVEALSTCTVLDLEGDLPDAPAPLAVMRGRASLGRPS